MTMSQALRVVQAFDRAVIMDIPADDSQALETKLASAARMMRERDAWLKPYQRSAILQGAADLLAARRADFARLIAQEGGKPLTDATAEAARAVDGLRDAAEELRNFAGREIPMGLTPASDGRWAFTTKEPTTRCPSLDASTVLINDHTAFRTDWMPFAGRRQSGYGVGGIPWSMTAMSQEKMLVLRHDE
jgi:acyl-CoA reductase-like NAD-dependent aldehyde dehydrogenase